MLLAQRSMHDVRFANPAKINNLIRDVSALANRNYYNISRTENRSRIQGLVRIVSFFHDSSERERGKERDKEKERKNRLYGSVCRSVFPDRAASRSRILATRVTALLARGRGINWLKLTPTPTVRQCELTTVELDNRWKRHDRGDLPRVHRHALVLVPVSYSLSPSFPWFLRLNIFLSAIF